MGGRAISLDAGDMVDADLPWSASSGTSYYLLGNPSLGPFYNTEGYLAVRVWTDAGFLYGWFRVIDDDAVQRQLIIYEWAWNGTPGASIAAGQVPEPAGFSLGAGLAVALASWAARRKQLQAS